MMISEFIDRTGFEPTAKEYAKIEEAYYNFDGDKDAFCKAFVLHCLFDIHTIEGAQTFKQSFALVRNSLYFPVDIFFDCFFLGDSNFLLGLSIRLTKILSRQQV